MESFVGDWVKHKNPKTHKKLGTGEIVEHDIEELELDENNARNMDDICLRVKFQKKDKLVKISVKNLLAKYDPIEGLDSHIQNYLEERRQKHTCDSCGFYDEDIVTFRDSRLCNSCYDKLIVCERCRRRFYDNEIVHVETTGEIQCKACYNRTHVTCIECKKIVPRYRARKDWESENYLCDPCYDKKRELYYDCNMCLNPVKKDLFLIIPWKTLDAEENIVEREVGVCPSCASKHAICERCGGSFIPKSIEKICGECDKALRQIEWVKSLNIKNLKVEFWTERRLKNEGTTEVMTRLKNQSMKYDRIDYFEVLYIAWEYIQEKYHSLVVVYDEWYDNVVEYDYDNGVTISKLIREQPLSLVRKIRGKTINAKEHIVVHNEILTIWDRPIILKAMTNFDKNYGDRYDDNGFRMGIGNQYGDTSYFKIIGTVSNK